MSPSPTMRENSSIRLHGQVQEVVGVMKKNIDRLLDRDVALNNLMTRADDLETSASTYNQTTKQLRRKYWWKNIKVLMKTSSSLCSILFVLLDQRVYRRNRLGGDCCHHQWVIRSSWSERHCIDVKFSVHRYESSRQKLIASIEVAFFSSVRCSYKSVLCSSPSTYSCFIRLLLLHCWCRLFVCIDWKPTSSPPSQISI